MHNDHPPWIGDFAALLSELIAGAEELEQRRNSGGPARRESTAKGDAAR